MTDPKCEQPPAGPGHGQRRYAEPARSGRHVDVHVHGPDDGAAGRDVREHGQRDGEGLQRQDGDRHGRLPDELEAQAVSARARSSRVRARLAGPSGCVQKRVQGDGARFADRAGDVLPGRQADQDDHGEGRVSAAFKVSVKPARRAVACIASPPGWSSRPGRGRGRGRCGSATSAARARSSGRGSQADRSDQKRCETGGAPSWAPSCFPPRLNDMALRLLPFLLLVLLAIPASATAAEDPPLRPAGNRRRWATSGCPTRRRSRAGRTRT